MILPLLIREIARDYAARKALFGFLVELGEEPVGTWETLAAVRDRYKQAIIAKAEREALAGCPRWHDEIEGDECECGVAAWQHRDRCTDFDDLGEDPMVCDGCGHGRETHDPALRPRDVPERP